MASRGLNVHLLFEPEIMSGSARKHLCRPKWRLRMKWVMGARSLVTKDIPSSVVSCGLHAVSTRPLHEVHAA